MKKLAFFVLIGITFLLIGITTKTEIKTEKPPAEIAINENIYKNEEFGFQITLTENWKDYVTESREIPNGKLIDFSSATKFTNSGYAEIFNIAVTTISGTEQEIADCLSLVDDPSICDWGEIARSKTHVFASGHINGFPQDDQVEALRDYDKIIESFELLN